MLQTQSWFQFHHIRGRGTRKWWNYLCRTHAWPRQWLTSRFPWPFVFLSMQMTQDWCWCWLSPYFEFEELKSDETIYVELTRDLISECDITISVTCRSYSNANDTIIDVGVNFTIFEVDELEMRKEMTDVTMSVTCPILDTNDTVSIYEKYLRPGHGNRDVSLLLDHAREWYVISFLIFEFPNLKYGRIDTMQDRVCSICIRRNTTGHGNRDVTVTCYRSRVSST